MRIADCDGAKNRVVVPPRTNIPPITEVQIQRVLDVTKPADFTHDDTVVIRRGLGYLLDNPPVNLLKDRFFTVLATLGTVVLAVCGLSATGNIEVRIPRATPATAPNHTVPGPNSGSSFGKGNIRLNPVLKPDEPDNLPPKPTYPVSSSHSN